MSYLTCENLLIGDENYTDEVTNLRHLSEETKAKIRAKATGRQHSEETKAKLRAFRLGSHVSQETKTKISAKLKGVSNPKKAHKGSENPMFGKFGANHPAFGLHRTEEEKAKIREANTGEKSHNWKGDKATKSAGRSRARRRFNCPEGMECHHKDGNPLNNNPENIEFVTRKQHVAFDGRLNGSKNPMFGKHHSEEWKAKKRQVMLGNKYACKKGAD